MDPNPDRQTQPQPIRVRVHETEGMPAVDAPDAAVPQEPVAERKRPNPLFVAAGLAALVALLAASTWWYLSRQGGELAEDTTPLPGTTSGMATAISSDTPVAARIP